MPEWVDVVTASGLTKHTDIISWLKSEHGLTHGFANGIALAFREGSDAPAPDDLVSRQFAGPKAVLRPLFDRLLAEAVALGDDVDVAPKKASVSLRRGKQFALIEAPSAKRIQLGIQLKGEPTTDRLVAGNAMCSHKVILTNLGDIDAELLGWLRLAYERA